MSWTKKDSKTSPCLKSKMMTATPFQDKQHSQFSLVCQAQSVSDGEKKHSGENRDLAVALWCAHPVASKSPSFFPLIKVCFDLSISPQTTIKKAIYQINTEYCKSHLHAACRFPRRGCHANSCSVFIVQTINFNKVRLHSSEDRLSLAVPPHFPNVHTWQRAHRNQVRTRKGSNDKNNLLNVYILQTL